MKRRFAILVVAVAAAMGTRLFAQETTVFSSPAPAVSAEAPMESAPADASPAAPPAPVEAQPPQAPQPPKRSWMSRLVHPFSGGKKREPDYTNPKIRGLFLELQLTPQTVKLSEVRQLNVHVTVTNKGKKAVTLDFPTDQRIDIHLMNSSEVVLTRWSDNHAVKEKPGTLLINPQEHVEYKETIATRDLSPDKVYTIEVFFPRYPELRLRQKFLTAP